MLEVILLVSLGVWNAPALEAVYKPCVWPNRCGPVAATATASVKPCVWPNRCGNSREAVSTAAFRPCVWPNRCKAEPSPLLAVYKPCVWPNRCAASPASEGFFGTI